MISKNYKKLTYLVLLGVFASCNSTTNQTEQQESIDTTKSQATTDIRTNVKEALQELPPPSEVPYILEASGADYNEKLLNDPKKAESYQTISTKAALNAGVYACDLGYASSYGKTQNAMNYLKAVQKLSDNLGITSTFEAAVAKRFENNLNNKDSLTHIVSEAMSKSDQYLRNNNRLNTAAMIVTGSFIEGLFIATGLIENYPKTVPDSVKNQVLVRLITIIVDQEKTVKNLISSLDTMKDNDAEIEKLKTHLKELTILYTKLNLQEQIKNNDGKLILTDKNLKEITEKVKEIRKEVIK